MVAPRRKVRRQAFRFEPLSFRPPSGAAGVRRPFLASLVLHGGALLVLVGLSMTAAKVSVLPMRTPEIVVAIEEFLRPKTAPSRGVRPSKDSVVEVAPPQDRPRAVERDVPGPTLPLSDPSFDSEPGLPSIGNATDAGIVPPAALSAIRPDYPERERRLSRETDVQVRFLVHKDGGVSDVTIVSGPREFGESVRAAILSARFLPARKGDYPTAVWMVYTFHFRLTNGVTGTGGVDAGAD